jgi:GT2 family glycosyltransferase
MIELSVVIPTYNRLETLRRCLAALDLQTLDRERFEIIVVDDGSTDGTRAEMQLRQDIRFLMQPHNGGPSAARNAGVRAAAGAWVLFMGDDIIAPPAFLEQHLAAHAEVPGEEVVVLGYTPWGPNQPVSPLMRYLFDGRSFQQFRYYAITDPDHVPYKFFYTCNLSVGRDFMLKCGLFDEELRYAYGEDTELAYRLARHGLRIIYRRAIVADHYHITTYRSARRRARIAGEVSTLIARKHPELADLSFLPFPLKSQILNQIRRTFTERVLDPALELADRRQWDHPLLAKLYDWALRKHQLWGVMDAVEHPKIVARPPAAHRA